MRDYVQYVADFLLEGFDLPRRYHKGNPVGARRLLALSSTDQRLASLRPFRPDRNMSSLTYVVTFCMRGWMAELTWYRTGLGTSDAVIVSSPSG